MKLKIKKIIQVFMPIILFSLYNIKAMDQNIDFYLKNLPHDVIGEILGYIANPKSISNVTQANIDKIKDLRKDESNENKLSGITKFLEVLKKSTCDYLGKFKGKPGILIEEAIKLDTEFSQECLKELVNFESKNYSSEIAKKANEIFRNVLSEGKVKIVKFLIETGVNLNVQNEDGNTALIVAASRNYKDIVELLLKNGADPDIQTDNENRMDDGNTALIVAASRNYKDIVELLLKDEADPNIQNQYGKTALIVAADKAYKYIVKLLLKNRAKPNIKDYYGNTALISAVDNAYRDIEDYKNIVKLLLKNGADPNIQTDNKYSKYHGNTALILAASRGYKDIVELLLENGADPNIQNQYGKTASEIAFIQGYKDIANFIKKYEKSILSSALDKGYEYISSFIKK